MTITLDRVPTCPENVLLTLDKTMTTGGKMVFNREKMVFTREKVGITSERLLVRHERRVLTHDEVGITCYDNILLGHWNDTRGDGVNILRVIEEGTGKTLK